MDEPRRTIEEIVALHQLEDLLDIYVEGPRDAAFVRWILKAHGKTAVVYDILAIEVSGEVMRKHGLEGGNRGRTITLALELEGRVPANSVRCLADSDLDFILWRRVTAQILRYTDYTSMELYSFKPSVIANLLHAALVDKGLTGESVLKQLGPPLVQILLLRAALADLRLQVRVLDPGKQLKIRSGQIRFDFAGYQKRLLNAAGKKKAAKEVSTKVREFEKRVGGDLRRYIHGYDFVCFLAVLIRHHASNKRFGEQDVIAGFLRAGLNPIEVGREALFADILAVAR